MTNEFDTV